MYVMWCDVMWWITAYQTYNGYIIITGYSASSGIINKWSLLFQNPNLSFVLLNNSAKFHFYNFAAANYPQFSFTLACDQNVFLTRAIKMEQVIFKIHLTSSLSLTHWMRHSFTQPNWVWSNLGRFYEPPSGSKAYKRKLVMLHVIFSVSFLLAPYTL